MRKYIASASVILLAMALEACSGQGSGQAQASSAPQGEQITAVGCPTAGPTPQCLTISANGKTYDLAGAGVDTSKNVGISLTATAVGEVTPCGVKLTNAKVEYLGLSCGMAPAVTAGGEVRDPYR
jgi:hypothetical protein